DGEVRDLDADHAFARDRRLDPQRARREREGQVVVQRLDTREQDPGGDLELLTGHDRPGRDLDDLCGDVEVRERLLDDLGALPNLRAGPRVTGVAEAEDVERRQRPVTVGFGVQDAFDGHVLVRQPGDGGWQRAVRR